MESIEITFTVGVCTLPTGVISMDDAIVTLYCLCDDFLRSTRHRDDSQRLMTDAEVMTAALVAALYFGGNLEAARRLLDAPRYIPTMLSKSRLNRRLHAIQPRMRQLFDQLAEDWKRQHASCILTLFRSCMGFPSRGRLTGEKERVNLVMFPGLRARLSEEIPSPTLEHRDRTVS